MYSARSVINLSGFLAVANLVIFNACFDRNLIEFPIPQEVAYEISVFNDAGPGIPASGSHLPALEAQFAHIGDHTERPPEH